MDDYGTGWLAAKEGVWDALDRVLEEAESLEDCEPLFRSELGQLKEEAEGENFLEGEALEGLQEGTRIHRERLLKVLNTESDWEVMQPRIHDVLDELSNVPDSFSKLRKELGLD